MAWLDRDAARLHYTDSGTGLPVLLTHGFGASGEMWRPQIDVLGDRYRFITWDMRGHGRTQCPMDDAQFTHEHTMADLLALLDHLELEQAVIGGHSLGGYMSLAFHARHPTRVGALYAQACGPGYRNDEARARWNERARSRAERIAVRGFDGSARAPEVAISVAGTPAGLAAAARGILTQVDATVIDSLRSVAVPALIVVGSDDTPFVDATAYMESRIPGARRVVVSGAGHGVNVEAAEPVTAALGEFLAALTL